MNLPKSASPWKPVVALLLASLATLNLAVLWYGRDYMFRGFGDFTAFYTAGTLLRRGQGADLYDRDRQWKVQQEFAASVDIRGGPLPYIRPPFQALIFLPLSLFGYKTAWVLWLLLKGAILFSLPFLLRHHIPGGLPFPPLLTGFFLLALAPVGLDLLQGQDAVLFLLFAVLAFTAARSGSERLAGIFLGLGLFKFHLVLPLLILLGVKRKWSVIWGCVATGLVLLLISAAIVGWRGPWHYPVYLWNVSHLPHSGVMAPESMPNLRGLIAVLLPPGERTLADWIYLAFAAAGLGATYRLWKNHPEPRVAMAGLSLAIVMTILVSFYFSGYDMMLLLLPALLLGNFVSKDKNLPAWCRGGFFVSLAALLLVPLSWTLLFRVQETHWMTPLLLLLAASIVKMIVAWSAPRPQVPS